MLYSKGWSLPISDIFPLTVLRAEFLIFSLSSWILLGSASWSLAKISRSLRGCWTRKLSKVPLPLVLQMMFFQRQLFASWFLCVGASLLVHEHWFRLLGDCSGARWGPSSPLLQFGGWPPTIQTACPEHLQTPQNLPVEWPVFLRQCCASAQASVKCWISCNFIRRTHLFSLPRLCVSRHWAVVQLSVSLTWFPVHCCCPVT